MTKLKNTKKGMAKKALSISLVAAMLATSNVPVWAAEDIFSDNSAAVEAEAPVDDVDVFSSEEAPATDDVAPAAVVEEAETGVELQAATDYTVKTNLKLKDGDWATALELVKKDGVAESVAPEFNILDKNTVPVDATKIEIYSGKDLLETLTVTNGDVAAALATYKVNLVGYMNSTQVTAKVYVENETSAVYEFTATVKPVDINAVKNDGVTHKWKVEPVKSEEDYNGTYQRPTVKVTSGLYPGVSADVVVKFDDEKEAKAVGSYSYHVEGVEASGFTGTLKSNTKFEIKPVTPNKSNLSVVISGDATYNGDATAPKVVVTDKLTNTVIPEELYSVTTAKKDAGTYTKDDIKVTLIASAKIGTDTKETANNFKAVDVPADCISGQYKVNALDLSKLGDTYTVSVEPQIAGSSSPISDANWAGVTFTDKKTNKQYSGKTEIGQILPVDKLTLVVSNYTTVGTGKITIRPSSATETNIINEFSTNFDVVGGKITDEAVAFPAGTKINGKTLTKKASLKSLKDDIKTVLGNVIYTGSDVEPLKDAFSNLVLAVSPTVTDQKLIEGRDYDLVYTDNIDSEEVSGKTSKVTLKFKGDYAGTISYDFVIKQATAHVNGKDVPYVAGKTTYDVSAEVYTLDAANNKIAVPEKEYVVTTTKKATGKDSIAEGVVVFENKNYIIDGVSDKTNKTEDGRWYKEIRSTVIAKKLSDCTATIEGSYVFTGETISPKLIVKDGSTTLVEGTDYYISSKIGTNAGPAHVTITGMGNYTGTLTVDYTIAKANISNAVVSSSKVKEPKNYDNSYTGVAVEPDVKTVKIGNTLLEKYNPITKKGDYTLTWDENAVEVGTYNFTITALASSTKVEGELKGTFKVTPHQLTGHFATKIGSQEVTKPLEVNATGAYYTGAAITMADFKTKYVLIANNKVLTEGKDYKLVYTDNIDAGEAKVVAYGLGNYAAVDANGKELAIASMSFYIAPKDVITVGMVQKISDVEYAGGLPVEPQVIIVDEKGNRLVQGVDYTVSTTITGVTPENGKPYTGADVTVKGKGAYVTGTDDKAKVNTALELKDIEKLSWKVTKKDLATAVVSVSDKTVTVMNGTVIVPDSEYDVKFSEDGKKVTVSAKSTSKNYTGAQEKLTDSKAVGTPVIAEVKVTNNKANIILSGDVDNAIGYDYVVSTVEDYKNGRVAFDKNQVATQSTIQYLQKGEYYAYLHAWKRVDGKKVFGGWSNIVKFTVTTTTPDQPLVTSVTRSGSTVKVTYTKTKNATGYDIVLGSKTKKVNGELRPVEYGKLVKKITKGNVVTATFKNVPKGTYYAGLHAYNRTSVNNSKVFSPWSNSKKVVVK